MRLYHGSTVVVEKPRVDANVGNTDFGPGFYTTTSLEQAIRWAKTKAERQNASKGYVSVYELDDEKVVANLVVRRFSGADAEWLRFVTSNRNGVRNPILVDLTIGPVADDNVYQTIRLFETGLFDEEEAIKRLKTELLHDQIVIHTTQCLQYLRFVEAIEVENKHD